MTTSVRISCINKTNRSNAWERISNVGGVNGNGSRWKLTTNEAISDIETKKFSFYVERPLGDRVEVIVSTSAAGNKYLKTVGDGDQPNNLLSLPECP